MTHEYDSKPPRRSDRRTEKSLGERSAGLGLKIAEGVVDIVTLPFKVLKAVYEFPVIGPYVVALGIMAGGAAVTVNFFSNLITAPLRAVGEYVSKKVDSATEALSKGGEKAHELASKATHKADELVESAKEYIPDELPELSVDGATDLGKEGWSKFRNMSGKWIHGDVPQMVIAYNRQAAAPHVIFTGIGYSYTDAKKDALAQCEANPETGPAESCEVTKDSIKIDDDKCFFITHLPSGTESDFGKSFIKVTLPSFDMNGEKAEKHKDLIAAEHQNTFRLTERPAVFYRCSEELNGWQPQEARPHPATP